MSLDYEKRYNAALEKLQEALAPTKDGCKISGLTRGCIENIFPELKNEDERIREDLMEWIEEFPDIIWRGHYKKDVFAWLEKQKTEEVEEVVFRPTAGCDIDSAARQSVEKQRVSGKNIVLAFNGAYIPVDRKTTDEIVAEYYNWIKKQGEKDKLIQELAEYKVKYPQDFLENHLNSIDNNENKDEVIRKAIKTCIKHLETQLGYDVVDGVDILDIYSWLEKQ